MARGPIQAFQDAHTRAGIETQLGENLCFGISFHLAPTEEQAIAEARPFFEEHAKMFGPLGFLGQLTEVQLTALGERGGVTKAGIQTLEESCAKGSWYCGPPEGLVERLGELGETFPGLTTVNVQSAMGTPQTVMVEQLDWFAPDVMPAFR